MVGNCAPGAPARPGLGYEVVSAINLRPVICSVATLVSGG
jgi:crotonobetainyl-CoA:carnitine CoA-transferase CaiB-like acyl-CoA transferase